MQHVQAGTPATRTTQVLHSESSLQVTVKQENHDERRATDTPSRTKRQESIIGKLQTMHHHRKLD